MSIINLFENTTVVFLERTYNSIILLFRNVIYIIPCLKQLVFSIGMFLTAQNDTDYCIVTVYSFCGVIEGHDCSNVQNFRPGEIFKTMGGQQRPFSDSFGDLDDTHEVTGALAFRFAIAMHQDHAVALS